jgi:hypothetical protein
MKISWGQIIFINNDGEHYIIEKNFTNKLSYFPFLISKLK